MNSFIAFYNNLGVACASDTDNTIYRLSKEEPVGIAICPYSPIPWESIVTQYLRKGEPLHHKDLEGYARDFEAFLKDFPADKSWNKLGINELNLIFLGYGEDEIYPSTFDVQIEVDEESGKMKFGPFSANQIDTNEQAKFCWIGNWELLNPILHGSTYSIRDLAISKQREILETYKQRLLTKFKGTDYEEYVGKCLENFNSESFSQDIIGSASDKVLENVLFGLCNFSIEEMVGSAENLVNANIRLNHLKNGGRGHIGNTKEIAVITRAEGFSWIKHSLFAI